MKLLILIGLVIIALTLYLVVVGGTRYKTEFQKKEEENLEEQYLKEWREEHENK